MTKTVIEMAREVEFEVGFKWCVNFIELERFAELVRADEREACAKVSEEYDDEYDAHTKQTKQGIAAAIRARSNT